MTRIFISYARKDGRELALWLKGRLETDGYEIWLDTSEIEGGASWSSDIEEAIENCDLCLALLSHGSFVSEICRAEQLRVLRKGKRLIPILVQADAERPLHLEHFNYRDFTDESQFDTQYATLLTDLTSEKVTDDIPIHKTKVIAPKFPDKFIPRTKEMDELRQLIIGDDTDSNIALTALRGMGGIGKTILGIALCYDEVIQDAFPDGVIWVEVGRENVSITDIAQTIGQALDDPAGNYPNETAAVSRIREILPQKSCLIILDDIWDVKHVRPFAVEAPRGRVLFTTRNSDIATEINAAEMQLGTLTPEQAVALLKEWAERDDPDFTPVAERVGNLPLALKLIGAKMKKGITGKEWLESFKTISQLKLKRQPKDYHESIMMCFELSVDELSDEDQSLYHTLGIFPEDTWIPQHVVTRLWQQIDPDIDVTECDEIIEELERLALITRNMDEKTLTMHDLLHDYNRHKLGDDLPATHNTLLTAYKSDDMDWWTMEDDGYIYAFIAHHLINAGKIEILRDLLLNIDWLQAKLNATNANSMIDDCELFEGERPIQLIQSAIRMSAHVFDTDPQQLPSQLYGRLLGHGEYHPEIQSLLQSIKKHETLPALCTAQQTMQPAGGPLLRTLVHGDEVISVAHSPDGKYVASGGGKTTKIWVFETGALLHKLEGHLGNVYGVTCSKNGRCIVSGSKDNTVKVWDAETGAIIQTLEGHGDWVWSVACSSDGGRIVSGSNDRTVKVWDAETGANIHTLEGHRHGVRSVAYNGDGGRIVSGSNDRTVKVWDAETGANIHTLEGHRYGVRSVAYSGDGGHIVSGSNDRTVKVWDAETGANVQTLEGHSNSVTSVAYSGDGGHIVSGSKDNMVKVWVVQAGAIIHALERHSDSVRSVAYHGDACYIVSMSWDNTLKVWDTETGAMLEDTKNTSQTRAEIYERYGNLSLGAIVNEYGVIVQRMGNDMQLLRRSGEQTLFVFTAEGVINDARIAENLAIAAGDAGGNVHILHPNVALRRLLETGG